MFALPNACFPARPGHLIGKLPTTLGDRLTAGQQILALLIKVRILVPQPPQRSPPPERAPRGQLRVSRFLFGPHRLAVRTPASHVGNTGSIPVGVTIFPSENGKIASAVLPKSETEAKPVESRPALTVEVLRRKLDAAIDAEAWEAVKAIRERMVDAEREAAGNVVALDARRREGR